MGQLSPKRHRAPTQAKVHSMIWPNLSMLLGSNCANDPPLAATPSIAPVTTATLAGAGEIASDLSNFKSNRLN
jgi:hypothetical protein